jgi:hypothetical protein
MKASTNTCAGRTVGVCNVIKNVILHQSITDRPAFTPPMDKYLGCFRKHDNSFETFRSKELAVFALFDIGRKDSAKLLSVVEKIDLGYHKTVGAVHFAALFCGEYSETFLYLFRLYFTLVVPKKIIIEAQKNKEAEDDGNALQPSQTNSIADENSIMHGSQESASVTSHHGADVMLQAAVSEDKMPYHYLLGFLLVFMSIPDGNILSWLFWLCYPAQGKQPDHNSMEGLISVLWPKLDRFKEKVTVMKKKAQNLLIIVEPSDLDPSKLRMFDANTGGAWSKPLLTLRKRIRASTLGYFFWRRVSAHVDRVGSSIDEAYVRLKEPYKLSKWGKKNIALTGERKAARKEVRVLVRLHMSYLQLLAEHDGSEITGSRRGSSARSTTSAGGDDGEDATLVQRVYLVLTGIMRSMKKGLTRLTTTSAKVHPTVTSSKGVFGASGSSQFSAEYSDKYAPAGERRFSTMDWVRASLAHVRQVAARPAPIVVDKDEFISLEEKYKESLQVPIDTVYKRVSEAQARAQRMLELCEEEVGQSTFAPAARRGSTSSSLSGDNPPGEHMSSYI